MAPTSESRRSVFRRIARKSHVEWPAYDSTPLYDRSSLTGLESDLRTVSEAWFDHDAHTSVELFVCTVPLAYFRFDPHDRYANSTRYEMDTLFRLFVLKELHGWDHETALVEYLNRRSVIREQLGIESIPDQSTLWRSWNTRFTKELRETIETVARTILITAQNAGIMVPREPDRMLRHHDTESDLLHTLDSENTTRSAAIDVGANNTLAVVTETGDTAVYHARPEFDRFQQQSERIATLQAELPDDQYTSNQIRRVYDERSRRRDHSRDAAVKHAAEWLLERNVDTVYVGDLTGVLETRWSATVNEKTHAFWSHRQLVARITLTLGDIGITVMETGEYDSSSECPACRSDAVTRSGDSFRCDACGLEAHADVAGAWNILQSEVGPMARPAALSAERGRDAPLDGAYWQWNDHNWTPADCGEQSWSLDQPGFSKPVSSQPG